MYKGTTYSVYRYIGVCIFMPEETKYTTVTPVLSSTIGYLEDVRDQVANIIRWMIMNPGFTSSIWENDLISFRRMSSEFESDRNTLVAALTDKCSAIFNRMFADYEIVPEFRAEDLEPDNPNGKYKVIFSVTIHQEGSSITESALVNGTFVIDPVTKDIQLNFVRSSDTAGLLI